MFIRLEHICHHASPVPLVNTEDKEKYDAAFLLYNLESLNPLMVC